MNLPGFRRLSHHSRPAYRLYQLAWTGLDWLYPPRCGGCGIVGSRWCGNCGQNSLLIASPYCPICGQNQEISRICSVCRETRPAYSALRSWAVYRDPVRQAIHRMKYEGDIGLGEILARPLVQVLEESSWALDLVIPVPVGAKRKAERGYNQAALLALPVALKMGLSYKPKGLMKVRQVRSQVGLTIEERHSNVKGAFKALPDIVAGKRVLIVDDVVTSGATMAACSQAILDAGAHQVYGLTLARTHVQDW